MGIGDISREAVRLCGIRREPLESWIKDAKGRIVPELRLNLLLMTEAFLQLLATGLGALILISAATVVVSTKIKKMDFWFVTAIGIIQTAKVVGFISPTARFFVQFPAAYIHMQISRWRRPGHDVRDVTEYVGLASLVPILFAAAPMVTALGCAELSVLGMRVSVSNYGSSDTDPKRGNIKPALIVFYSLVLVQSTVFSSWFSASLARTAVTRRVRREYFGIGNTKGVELMDRYITQTQDKCIEKGVFSTTNRTLVSFAQELLQSEHRTDHVSAVSVLHLLTTTADRAAGAVEQISSSEQAVGSLFKLLRPKCPLDLDAKVDTAEILTKLAGNLRLTDIPGAVHSISSLLDPHPRSMKTATNAGHPEPPAPRETSPQGETQTQTNNTNQGGAEPQTIGETHINIANSDASGSDSEAEPSSAQEIQNQTTNTNEGGARDKPLIAHGLMILDRLASDPGNCTEICKTADLVPKILAPLTHGLLKVIGTNDPITIQIVKASLRVVAKLTSATCESSSKLRRELVSENDRTARNIMWIMRNSSDEQEMRVLAVEIVTRLTLGQPSMRGLFDSQDSPPAGEAQNALVDLHSWEVICQEVGNLVALMNEDGTSTEHRAVTAQFLAQICAKSKTDQDRMDRLSSVSNSLSKVLEAIVSTEIKDMTTERRKFLASFLDLAVQIGENLVTTNEVRGLPMGIKEKLKEIIEEMMNGKESEDVICLVITKAATKLVTWTMSIDPDNADYFQRENIVDMLEDGNAKAMSDLERCSVLRGDADEMEPPYETLQMLMEALKSRLFDVLGTAGQAA